MGFFFLVEGRASGLYPYDSKSRALKVHLLQEARTWNIWAGLRVQSIITLKKMVLSQKINSLTRCGGLIMVENESFLVGFSSNLVFCFNHSSKNWTGLAGSTSWIGNWLGVRSRYSKKTVIPKNRPQTVRTDQKPENRMNWTGSSGWPIFFKTKNTQTALVHPFCGLKRTIAFKGKK